MCRHGRSGREACDTSLGRRPLYHLPPSPVAVLISTHLTHLPPPLPPLLPQVNTLETGEIDYEELRAKLVENSHRPAILNVNIGTTVKGAVDDLDKVSHRLVMCSQNYLLPLFTEMSDTCRRSPLGFHAHSPLLSRQAGSPSLTPRTPGLVFFVRLGLISATTPLLRSCSFRSLISCSPSPGPPSPADPGYPEGDWLHGGPLLHPLRWSALWHDGECLFAS